MDRDDSTKEHSTQEHPNKRVLMDRATIKGEPKRLVIKVIDYSNTPEGEVLQEITDVDEYFTSWVTPEGRGGTAIKGTLRFLEAAHHHLGKEIAEKRSQINNPLSGLLSALLGGGGLPEVLGCSGDCGSCSDEDRERFHSRLLGEDKS